MGNPKLFTNEFGIEGYRMAFFEVAPELFLDVCQQYSPDIPDDARFIRVELPPDNTFPPCAGCYQNKTIRLIVESEKFLLYGEGQRLEKIFPTFASYQCECGKIYPIRNDHEYCPYCGRKHGKKTD